MKILHVNTYDSGGAAIANIRIHLAMLEKGIDSKMLVLYKSSDIPHIYEFNYWASANTKIKRFVKRQQYKRYKNDMDSLYRFKVENPVEAFTYPISIFDITEHPLYKEADLIVLNWVAGFLDEPSFFRKNTKPVVWIMEDLYVCGGGYHYEKGFLFDIYKKQLERNYKVREKCLKGKVINLVAISNWEKEKAEESNLLKNQPVNVIHHGVDTSVFRPYDKSSAREMLGIPQDKKMILVGAQSLSNPRKGTALLMDVFKDITDEDILFYGFGSNENSDTKISSLGFIKDETLLAKIYSAADLFVMSSIEEAFGQVFIESLACGTAVVSFPNGGALDIIKNGFNGFIADDFTSDSLLKVINKGLNVTFDKGAIRKDIIDRFDIRDKAGLHIKLYESILKQ